GRIGADRHEADMSERYLARKPEQYVEADAGDRRQRDGRDQEHRVAVGDDGIADGSRECQDGGEHGYAGGHTFLTPARPSSPLGRTTRMRITEAKVMIWV